MKKTAGGDSWVTGRGGGGAGGRKAPAGASTAAAVGKDGVERLLWGFGGVFKGDGRLGSGELP